MNKNIMFKKIKLNWVNLIIIIVLFYFIGECYMSVKLKIYEIESAHERKKFEKKIK